MRLFNNRTPPKVNESIYSYLFRCAQRNYSTTLGSMLHSIGPMVYRYNLNYISKELYWFKQYEKAIKLTGYDCTKLMLNRYDELFMVKERIGIVGSRVLFHSSFTRYCPYCYAEDKYHRLFWDLSMITICTTHETSLLEKCPNCQRKIYMSRLMADECRCGFIFSKHLEKNKNFTESEFGAQKAFQTKLHMGKKEYFDYFIRFCYVIDNLKIDNYLKGYDHKIIKFGQKNKSPRDLQMMTCLTTVVHGLIIHPEKYMPVLLFEIDQLSKESRKLKLRMLDTIYARPDGGKYKDEYKKYLSNLTTEFVNRRNSAQLNIGEKRYITMGEVIMAFGIAKHKLLHLIEQNHICKLSSDSIKGKVSLIEKQSVIDYIQRSMTAMSSHEVARYFGVEQATVVKMVHAELLIALHGPTHDGYADWIILREDAVNSLQSIFKHSQLLQSIPADTLSFRKANFAVRHLGVSNIELMKLISKGQLKTVVLESQNNFRGLFIDNGSLKKYILQETEERIVRWGYTVGEISKMYGVDLRKIRNDIRNGTLVINHSNQNSNGTTSHYISGSEAFLKYSE
ncbi:TniQ family protein [Paenibacillus protaetiae]|uniref:TniQ domain-containing protein n=1 Tax=Paenibacillus protaetiae TaxID=2509456 RepID=A0A4P6ETV5_9BACL|nr:TniQ family protein [Paenibacillus protaetiae]QAY66344.1 hypothetical protein ET464_07935 [Paenibacillus protaetiae]